MAEILEPQINFSSASFKDLVIKIVKSIPYGRVTSYGVVAGLANMPRGARSVGWILHYNGEKFDLPWHRVVNRYGFISTTCKDHIKKEQKALLEMEKVEVSDTFMIDLKKYGWWGNKKF